MNGSGAAFVALMTASFREILRQPITFILTAAASGGILLLPLVTTQTLGETSVMVTDGALALHFFFGVILAGTAACHAMSADLRRGTAATVLSKPVGRAVYLLAKFTGISAVLILFSILLGAETLVSVRIAGEMFNLEWDVAGIAMAAFLLALAVAGAVNFVTRRPFPSTAIFSLCAAAALTLALTLTLPREGAPAGLAGAFTWALIPVSVLVAMALCVMGGIALALSTRLELVATVTLCSVFFLLGLMSDYLFGRHASVSYTAAAFHAILPNWQHFWLADAVHLNRTVPWSYVASAGAYAGAYLLGVLSLGVISLRHREVPG